MADPEESEFTPKIGKVALRELAIHGYTTYDQLTKVTETELLALHGVGPTAIRFLADELEAMGLGFAEG